MKQLLFFSILIFASCDDASINQEIKALKNELAAAKEQVKVFQDQIEAEGDLVHIVFFKLKPEADQAALIAEIKKLEAIEAVMDLEVGPFEDLGDARALSDYSLVMQMSFENTETYKTYQEHPIHLALRETAKQYLGAPPATYDFMKK